MRNSSINSLNKENNSQTFEDKHLLPFKIPIEKIVYLICIITSFIIILSWVMGYEKALSILPGSPTMKFNTAVVFLLIGVNLFILQMKETFLKTLYYIVSFLIIVIGLLSIFSNYDIQFLNIDNIFGFDVFSNVKPGLMSAGTASCSFLIGVAFILKKQKKTVYNYFANKLIHVVNIISLISVVSFFLSITIDKQIFFLKSMAIHTSIIFYLVSFIILLKDPNTLVNRMIYGNNIGSVIFRKIIPNIILIPIILSNLLLILINREYFSVDFGIVLFVLTLIIFGLLHISSVAEKLNKSDIERKELEKITVDVSVELSHFKETINKIAIVVKTDPKGKITYVNDTFCEISQYSKKEVYNKKYSLISSNNHDSDFFKDQWSTISSGEIWSGNIRNKKKDGSFYWIKSYILPRKNYLGEIIEYITIETLIDKPIV